MKNWTLDDLLIGKSFIGKHNVVFTVREYFNERGMLFISFKRGDGAIRSETLENVHYLIGEKT